MNVYQVINSLRMAGLLGAAALVAACSTTDLPEVSADGLELVHGTRVDAVYRVPEADLGQYSRIDIAEVKVSFRANWLRDQTQSTRSLSHRVSQEDADQIKAAIADSFERIFTEELEKGGYQVVSGGDPKGDNSDLLLLIPAIVDLDVAAPDNLTPGRTRSYTASAGSMALELEFRDSITGDLLGRIYDSREAPDNGRMMITNSVTNKSEADRMLRRWARMLVEGLDKAHGK